MKNQPEDFWDQMYQTSAYLYGLEPNEFLVEELDKLTAGRLLLPSEGEGRNAVYAALQGWQVDAFDISERGKEKALALAQRNAVVVNYRLADFAQPQLTPNRYDVVALIYSHVPRAAREIGFQHIKHSLRSKGTVIIEAFSPGHLEINSPFGPKTEDLLYCPNEVQRAFDEFTTTQLEEQEVTLSEGRHDGKGIVLRMVAVKR